MENIEPTGTEDRGRSREQGENSSPLPPAPCPHRSRSVSDRRSFNACGGLRQRQKPPLELLSTSFQSSIPKTQLLLYLIPIIGFFPSLWTLYRRDGSREQLATSRVSITLAFTWLLGYFLLSTSAATSDFFTLRLFILNSFFTSGYFLVSIWLIFRLLQGKSVRLPVINSLAQKVVGKHLS